MAITTTGTLTQEFVDALSAEMIPKPDDQYPFWAGLNPYAPYGPGSVRGSNVIKMNQPALVGGTMSETARRLTEGTDITTTPIAITEGQFSMTVREYGGPHDGSVVAPLGVTEFLRERAAKDLLADLGGKLRRDYIRWRDAVVRDIALTTTTSILADPAATEANIVAAKAASAAWLARVRKQLATNLIPPLPSTGRWIGYITSKDVMELATDTTIAAAKQTRDDHPAITGYVTTVHGIDLFEATYMPTKGVGSGGAVTGYQSIFIGTLPTQGYYQGKSVSVRRNNNDDFGRKDLLAWVSHEAYGALDINAAAVRGLTT